jgi:Xaa-Pro aminopeptidase
MNRTVTERLFELRSEMRSRGIDACIIPSSDPHLSEYIHATYKYRHYFSGFSGSAGTLFITADKGFLITDGRYFLQAESQLEGTGITLVRQGIEGEPDIYELCQKYTPAGGKLFADGKLISGAFAEKINDIAMKNSFTFECEDNPVTAASHGMPALEFSEINALPFEIHGESTVDKIKKIRDKMVQNKADGHIISSLEEIAWILNLRADDIPNNPVFYSFMHITDSDAHVFLGIDAAEKVSDIIAESGVTVHEYYSFYDYVKSIHDSTVMLDKSSVNASVIGALGDSVKVIDAQDPAIHLKAIKNAAEIENSVRVHIHDGLAVARFMHWVKNADLTGQTEISCTAKLEEFRRMCPHYLSDSFDTICAYGANGAIVHYSATPESNTAVKNEAALLVDSGGQYNGGTTDITRMFVLGETTEDFKIHYTTVLKSMLKLQNTVFLKDTKCALLDMLAREPMWKMGLDYRHGTGHGVGYMLSVHEGPQRIHYANFKNSIEPGMVTSDEPGLYIEGKHGIRIENEILCTKAFESEYGIFYKFMPLTVCPIDTDAIIPEMLDESEKQALNEYHAFVYEKLSTVADYTEIDWLKEYTKAI